MAGHNPKVDQFIANASHWQAEYRQLREILSGSPLDEDLKWGVPCYTYQGKNIVLMHGFKDYCALLFPKGALLKDPKAILVQQTENVQAARQIRFRDLQEISEREPVIAAYVLEAIEVEKSGLKVDFKATPEFKMPEEFQLALDADPSLKAAFEGLTPGRQRAYLLHFSAPKQAKTRAARIEKHIPHILNGKGLNDH